MQNVSSRSWQTHSKCCIFVFFFSANEEKELCSSEHFLLSSAQFPEIALCFHWLLLWPEKLEVGEYLHIKALIHWWQKETFLREICGKVTKVTQTKKINQRVELILHPQPPLSCEFCPHFELRTTTSETNPTWSYNSLVTEWPNHLSC